MRVHGLNTILILVVSIIAAASAWAGDAAMVVDVSPGVVMHESGARSGDSVSMMDFVAEGDQIRLNGGFVVLNYFSSGIREKISGNGLLDVGTGQSSVGKGLKLEKDDAGFKPPQALIEASEGEHMGVVALRGVTRSGDQGTRGSSNVLNQRKACFASACQGDGRIKPFNMFQTAVRIGSPVFMWESVPGAQKYIFRLSYLKGGRLLEATLKEPVYNYDGEGLSPEARYEWSIEAVGSGRTLARGGGEFWVLSSQDDEQVAQGESYIRERKNASPDEVQVGLAMLFASKQLYDDALNVLKPLASKFEGNETIKKYLALLDPGEGI